MVIVANESGSMLSSGVYPQRRPLSFNFNCCYNNNNNYSIIVVRTRMKRALGLWLRLECSLDSLSIVSTDHQIDRGLSVSLRLYEMCHVLVIV